MGLLYLAQLKASISKSVLFSFIGHLSKVVKYKISPLTQFREHAQTVVKRGREFARKPPLLLGNPSSLSGRLRATCKRLRGTVGTKAGSVGTGAGNAVEVAENFGKSADSSEKVAEMLEGSSEVMRKRSV